VRRTYGSKPSCRAHPPLSSRIARKEDLEAELEERRREEDKRRRRKERGSDD